MAPSNERAIIAGACFWGMRELLPPYSGLNLRRGGHTGGYVTTATSASRSGGRGIAAQTIATADRDA
jgi:peptide methionine sulfoxide reductase MsrA